MRRRGQIRTSNLRAKSNDGEVSGKAMPAAAGDSVDFEFSFGVLQRPRLMMNLAAIHLIAMRGVETIAFGQPVFE